MPLPDPVRGFLDELLRALDVVLGPTLVGLYARGSLALGDFDPGTSDVDVIVVTERAIDEAAFDALDRMHERLHRSSSVYARRLEAVYFDREAVRRFVPGQRHPTLGQDERLKWVEHGTNWIVERWTAREHGIPLRGPDPRTLIDPIASAELVAANRARLQDWVRWVEAPEDSDWDDAVRKSMAYAIETMCRLRYAIAHGSIASKPQAVRWALATFPEPWHTTVAWSQAWRGDLGRDPAIVPHVHRLIRWAAAQP